MRPVTTAVAITCWVWGLCWTQHIWMLPLTWWVLNAVLYWCRYHFKGNILVRGYVIIFKNDTQPLSCHPASLLDRPCGRGPCCSLSNSSTRAAGCIIRPTEVSQPLNPCDKGSLCLNNAWATWVNPLLVGCWRWADLCQEFIRAVLIDGGSAAKGGKKVLFMIWNMNTLITLFL